MNRRNFLQGTAGMAAPGLLWSAHYIDEDTGLAMRAASVWDPMTDRFICRWGVLCG